MPADAADEVGANRDLMGLRFGCLEVTGLAEWYYPPGGGARCRRWRCVCDCGAETIARHSDLRSGQMRSCGCRKRKLRLRVVKYRSAHQRVDRVRGLASAHACIDCGLQAREWSYSYQDPNELLEIRKRDGRVMAYSVDPEAYEPRCRSCHAKFDRVHSREAS